MADSMKPLERAPKPLDKAAGRQKAGFTWQSSQLR
jgi:hypothetical protein